MFMVNMMVITANTDNDDDEGVDHDGEDECSDYNNVF